MLQNQSHKSFNINKKQKSAMIDSTLLVIITLVALIKSNLLLNGVPFQFELKGQISYTPTSGGINIPGYILRVGYTKHQWIGIKFMELTSSLNYDALVFKRSTISNGGLYECSVSDYYISSSNPSALLSDTINNMDKQVTSLSASNHYFLEIYRTLGNTNGEDWQPNDFSKICFFTSDTIFSKDSWQAQYQVCYGFSVNNYSSTLLGYQINNDFQFNGVQSKIYGGIQGLTLSLDFYIYRPNPTLGGTQVTIKIGDLISTQVGYDYQKCLSNPGDYFGNSTAQLYQDLLYSGYNDNYCTVVTTGTSLLLHFTRNLNTYDDYDNKIKDSTHFCFIVGSSEDCTQLKSQIMFPQMEVGSAIQLFNSHYTCAILLFALMLLLI